MSDTFTDDQKQDIREQTKRIIGSQWFDTKASCQRILDFVVKEALSGNTVTNAMVTAYMDKFFPPDKRGDEDRRMTQNITNTRASLNRYYVHDGTIDKVVIEMLPGSPHPQFTFRGPLASSQVGRFILQITFDSEKPIADLMRTLPDFITSLGQPMECRLIRQGSIFLEVEATIDSMATFYGPLPHGIALIREAPFFYYEHQDLLNHFYIPPIFLPSGVNQPFSLNHSERPRLSFEKENFNAEGGIVSVRTYWLSTNLVYFHLSSLSPISLRDIDIPESPSGVLAFQIDSTPDVDETTTLEQRHWDNRGLGSSYGSRPQPRPPKPN